MFKDYNMNQVILPLDLEKKLQENDIAFHIHHLVESIPTEAFVPFYKETGCPSYHPKMMLKIILVTIYMLQMSWLGICIIQPLLTLVYIFHIRMDSFVCGN